MRRTVPIYLFLKFLETQFLFSFYLSYVVSPLSAFQFVYYDAFLHPHILDGITKNLNSSLLSLSRVLFFFFQLSPGPRTHLSHFLPFIRTVIFDVSSLFIALTRSFKGGCFFVFSSLSNYLSPPPPYRTKRTMIERGVLSMELEHK